MGTSVFGGLALGASPLSFVPVYVIGALAGVPAWTLVVAAGAAYVPLWGFVVASLSAVLAAAIGFLIARYLLRARIERIARRSRWFRALEAAVSQGDWRVVALVRLSPVVPYMLSNYVFGVTRVRFGPYLLAGWIATAPGIFFYVMMGHSGRRALSEEGLSPMQWAMLSAGLAATLALVIYLGRLARRALAEEERRAAIE